MICFPSNTPIKERINDNTKIIETCNHIVMLFDKPVCKVTPAASASIAVKIE